MKHYIFLTSALILAACGAGSGGGGSNLSSYHSSSTTVDTPPTVYMQGFNGATTVNSDNSSLTGMSSYTASYGTSESASQAEMIAYVSEHLGDLDLVSRSAIRGATRSSMSPRNRDVDPEFYNADVVITRMKQVLHDMSELSDDDLTQYINTYKKYVIQSLILWGADVNADSTTEQLATAFENTGLNSENIMGELDAFDTANFHITKDRMENVMLKGAGQESYFSFKLDDNGRIEKVSMMEMPELGDSNDDGKKYVWVPPVGETPGYLDRVNRGEDIYQVSKEGWFNRATGNTTNFANTMYEYVVTIGAHPWSGPSYSSDPRYNIRPDDLETLTVWLPDNLDLSTDDGKAALKAALLEQILAEGNKVFTEQASGSGASATDIVQWYYEQISDNFDDYVAGVTSTRVDNVVSMTGAGKDIPLKYADFGYFRLDQTKGATTETMYTPYAGGYDTRRADLLDTDTIAYLQNGEDGTTFYGTAVAAVEHTTKINGARTKNDMLVRDDNAFLTYKDGNHTLTMNNLKNVDNENQDWYRVVITGQPGTSLTYQFYDTNADTGNTAKNIPDEFQFFTATMDGDNMVVTPNSGISDPTNMAVNTKGTVIDVASGASTGDYRIEGDATPEYYGADITQPDEATVRFGFSEEWHNGTPNTHHNEVAVYGAFGGHTSNSGD